MSSAITRVGNSQVLRLQHKLIIGIRVDGTIVHLDTQHMHRIRPRPFLPYFAQTLKNLQCDVTLFIPAPLRASELIWKQFTQRHLPLPVHLIEDVLPDEVERSLPSYWSSAAFSYTNYGAYLHERARVIGSTAERVLLIENEISTRYMPEQTLIVHKYRYLTPRQIRKLTTPSSTREYQTVAAAATTTHGHLIKNSKNSITKEEMLSEHTLTPRELGLIPHSSHWEQYEHQLRVKREWHNAQNTTTILNNEQVFVEAASAEASYFNTHSTYKNLLRKVKQSQSTQSENNNDKSRIGEIDNSNPNTINSRTSTPMCAQIIKEHESKSIVASTAHSSSHSSLPALNLEDYTLVALSEMLTELASSEEWSVREYLEREPLIEQLSVPSYGSAFYLPAENCDNIVPLNWDEITVIDMKESKATNSTHTNSDVMDHNNSNRNPVQTTTEPDANFFR